MTFDEAYEVLGAKLRGAFMIGWHRWRNTHSTKPQVTRRDCFRVWDAVLGKHFWGETLEQAVGACLAGQPDPAARISIEAAIAGVERWCQP